MPKSPLAKSLIIGAGLSLLALLIFGFVVGAVGSELFGTSTIVKEPEVHLPASAVFPAEKREISARGGNLGFTGFAITNSMLSSWLTTIILIVIFVVAASRKSLVPGRLQGFVEVMVEGLMNFVEGVSGKGVARAFFPIIATIFLFVLFNAWMGLLPIYPSLGFNSSEDANAAYIEKAEEDEAMHLHGTITSVGHSEFTLKDGTVFHLEPESKVEEELAKGCSPAPCFAAGAVGEKVKLEALKSQGMLIAEHVEKGNTPRIDLLRPAGTDVNMPLALAIVAFLFVEIWGLRRLGFGYLAKFIRVKTLIKGPSRFFNGPIDLFVGILEGLSEIIRVVSFTFRLFGNMLAGKLLILVSAFLVPFVFSVPFYGLELLVGLIQAMIFAGLTLTFATLAISHHDD
jgi:F-type H+-transporting ATPase subunit a